MITPLEAVRRQYDFLRYARKYVGLGKQYNQLSGAMQWMKKQIKEKSNEKSR